MKMLKEIDMDVQLYDKVKKLEHEIGGDKINVIKIRKDKKGWRTNFIRRYLGRD